METLGKIINSVLSSLLVSIIMFILMYSFMTGEFPPNLARLKKSYADLHQMTRLTRQIQEQDTRLKKQYASTGQVNEQDLAALQEMNLQRAELGTGLLAGGSAERSSQERRIEELEKRVQQLEAQVRGLSSR